MKTVRIQALRLDHFKGIDALTIDFGGRSASIFGRNGTGKTTIMDAWMWLLTGKDSKGNTDSNFEIKPLNGDGEVLDHDQRTVVAATIAVDGENHELRREYYELWQTRRGDAEATYGGNSTDFYIDDVPKSKRDYEAWIEAVAPKNILRYLCDVGAFPSAKWQERRDTLFELADIGTDEDIMAQEPRFAPLMEATAGIGVSDLRAKLKAQRKKLVSRQNDIPAQIQENQRILGRLGTVDYEALQREADTVERELTDVTRLLSAAYAAPDAERDALETRQRELELELRTLEQRNREHRSALSAASLDRKQAEEQLEHLTATYRSESDYYQRTKEDYADSEAELSRLREDWYATNGRKWAGSTTCPTCGQQLPEAQIEAAKAAFEQDKALELKTIERKAADETKRKKRFEETLEQARDRMVRVEGEIAQAKANLEHMPPAAAVIDMEGYAEQKAEINRRIAENKDQQKRRSRDNSGRRTELMTRQSELRNTQRELLAQLADKKTMDDVTDRICELEEERRKLAGEMAEMDRLLDLSDEFLMFRTRYITDAVNCKFDLASFKMFDVQVNGGIVECCTVMYDGVPYDGGLNNGARINVGLDIIRTLSRFYGVQLPVFVDNAESVNELETIDGQVIRLVVTENDENVRVEK